MGSNPTSSKIIIICLDSSVVEHRAENSWVMGSNPILDNYLQNMFIKFKIFNRPIAPHLSVYIPQLSSLFSIWHRISGIGLAFFLTIVLIFIRTILSSNFVYNLLNLIPFEISQWTIIFLNLLVLLFLLYHLFNGMRHIIWDFGFFLDIKYLSKFSLFLLILIFLILINS